MVACAYQTHYCTYVRVPRLLALQVVDTPDELLLITTFQWFELWVKVLVTDARGVLADKGGTFESVKLLRRGIELFKLFQLQFDFDEHTLVREMHIIKALRLEPGLGFSPQQKQLVKLVRQLRSLTGSTAELDDVIENYTERFLEYRRRYSRLTRNVLRQRKKSVPTYADWVCLEELLDLHQGVKADWTQQGTLPSSHGPVQRMMADENMFIIVHQCFELWFKIILEHLDRVIGMMKSGQITSATRLMRRAVDIERLLIQQIQIPATMNPLDFARFRHESREEGGKRFERGLSPASGTESYQFREIEITAGLRDDIAFQNYLSGSEKLPIRLLTNRQREREQKQTLADAFDEALRKRGIQRVDDIFASSGAPNPNADLQELADILLEFDEAFRFWRLAHVSMVEKMIGAKSGTGFLGPEYLMETAGIRVQEKNRILAEKQVRPRFFEELWQVRTRLGTY